MPRRIRALDQLKPLLDRQLTVYALAATAYFGGGPAIAKGEVVYTSVKQFGEGELGARALIPIDLNHDGIADFTLVGLEQLDFSTNGSLHTEIVYVNGIVAASGTHIFDPEAKALPLGQKVGPALNFLGSERQILGLIFSAPGGRGSHTGNFFDQKNKFLALKFSLNGKSYYGWARVNVVAVDRNFVFELVDYAYQSTPSAPIRAGEGIPQADAALPASPGLLAYGSDAIPAWRR